LQQVVVEVEVEEQCFLQRCSSAIVLQILTSLEKHATAEWNRHL
jgi:hypothetical protein